MRELTEKQKNILQFIEEFSEKEGMAPTVYEIGEKFNIKTSTVFAHLKALQRKNQLTRSSKARSIALRNGRKPVPHMSFLTAIPLLGRINAGMPADAQEYRERDIYVESALLARFPNDKFFAFLDINPLAKGHTLVIPKQEVDYIFDLSDEDLAAMHVFAKKVALAIGKAFPCRKVGEAVLGLEVPHAHIHLIPMQNEKDMLFSNPKLKLTDEEFKAIAKAITMAF